MPRKSRKLDREQILAYLQENGLRLQDNNLIHVKDLDKATELLTRLKHATAMSRGTVVVDENVEQLSKPLEELNITVISIDKSFKSLDDSKIARMVFGNRILITENEKDFYNYASVYGIGIISVSKELLALGPKKAAKRISEEIIRLSLWSKRHGYVVRIKPVGKSVFLPLTD